MLLATTEVIPARPAPRPASTHPRPGGRVGAPVPASRCGPDAVDGSSVVLICGSSGGGARVRAVPPPSAPDDVRGHGQPQVYERCTGTGRVSPRPSCDVQGGC